MVNSKNITVAIDDGHGMATAGKRTPTGGIKSPETGKNFMHENEFNRAVGKYLEVELKRCGFRVLQVAPTDADYPLQDRVARANNAKADLYISIHANANTGKWGTWGGTETFTFSKGESLRIGRIIHKHLMKGTPLRDRGVKDGSHLYVIKNTKMPSVLLECAFMDNLEEAKLLLSDAFRRECAREVAMGICEAYGVKYVPVSQPKPTTPSTPKAPVADKLYRVRKNWSDPKSQIGAFKDLNSAKALADSKSKEEYKVFDDKGNIVYDPNPIKADKVWYRVRKSWADAKSQLGAFHDVASAKELADERAKDGYKVYDEKGAVVYAPKVETKPVAQPAPKPVTPAPTPTPVQPKPEPIDEHKNHTAIMGKSVVEAGKLASFVKSKNPNAKNIDEIAKQFIEVGEKYGVRGDIAFAQSIIETGWFKFDGGTAVTPDQHNYCGLGVTSKGMKGHSFATVKDGVTAQIQHLFAYATKGAIPNGEFIIDPRFTFVTRGIAPHWEDLSNRWAMNANYGTHILAIYTDLLNFKYTPKEEIVEEVKEENAVSPTPEVESNEDMDKQLSMWKKLVDYVFVKIAEIFGKK